MLRDHCTYPSTAAVNDGVNEDSGCLNVSSNVSELDGHIQD
jgi:hypothetical protein